MTVTASRRTPLFDRHLALGAPMVSFAGWEMPQQYSSIREEVHAVRTAAGVFDVSHMGEFVVRGRDALDFVQSVTTNDASTLESGRAQYSLMCNQEGGVVDDLLVYRRSDSLLLVVNAGRRQADWDWLTASKRADCQLVDESDDWALIAFQGPSAITLLAPLCDTDLVALRRNQFTSASLAGVRCTVSRTGYTGEDGVEILCPAGEAVRVWDALLAAGPEVRPCGLGARDVVRLESGLRLYGNDLDETVNPWAAGLDWVVKPDKGEFTGSEAMMALRPVERRRTIGLLPEGRAIARHGDPVRVDSRVSGAVTSGTFSFTLGRPIAMAMVVEAPPPGETVEVEVRGNAVRATVCELPFVKGRR
ncbi:MAG: glycine cleavage system aminomethyltransferase GcvT [Candidatus Dormibacteria bacterium]